jgi:type IV pilus assembly protein PilC
MEKAERIKNKVKSAMIYPIIVLVAAIAILTFLLTFIIPKFQDVFKELLPGEKLPAITRFVMNASKTVRENALAVVGVIAAIVIAIQIWKRTRSGRLILDRIKLNTPVFGTLIRRSAIARLTRTLGTLLSSGVPVLQALTIVRDTSGNAVVAQAIQHVHDSVKEGESMTAPMEASKVFPPMVISMVEVGEETGALPDMLIRIANTYDDEVDNAVSGLTSIIEPVMIIFLAVVVGTIVIAMFFPLVSIIENLTKQT